MQMNYPPAEKCGGCSHYDCSPLLLHIAGLIINSDNPESIRVLTHTVRVRII